MSDLDSGRVSISYRDEETPGPIGAGKPPEGVAEPGRKPGPVGAGDQSPDGRASDRMDAVGELDEILTAVEASRRRIIDLRYATRPAEAAELQSRLTALWRSHRGLFERLMNGACEFLVHHGAAAAGTDAGEPRWLSTLGGSTVGDLAVDRAEALHVIERIASLGLVKAREDYGARRDEAGLKNVLLAAFEQQLAGQMRGRPMPEETERILRRLTDEMRSGAPVLSGGEGAAAMHGWLGLFTGLLPAFVKPEWMRPAAKREAPREEKPAASQKLTWIDFKVVDEDTGKGISGVRLTVALSDGNQAYYTTVDDGTVHIGGIEPGTCSIEEVSHPDALEVVDLTQA